MTSIRQLKLVANAGDPDSTLALRIDIVQAAIEWYDTCKDKGPDWDAISKVEDKLERAIRKYKAAVKKRKQGLE